MLPVALSLLASTPAIFPSPDTISSGMAWAGGLVAFAICANQVLGAVANMKKLKGNDPAADERYATKAELTAVASNVTEIKAGLGQVTQTINNELREINRSLGTIEGQLRQITPTPH